MTDTERYSAAEAHHRSGNLGAARELYTEILAREPHHVEARLQLAILTAQEGDPVGTLAQLDAILATTPDRADVHASRGNLLVSLQRYDEAIADFDIAILLKPQNPRLYDFRSLALRALGRFDDALESINHAIIIDPSSAQQFCTRAHILIALSLHKEAIASCDQALALQDDHAGAHGARGLALLKLGRMVEAVSSLDRAISLQGDNAEFYCNRGSALEALKRPTEAIASYAMALQHDPDTPFALGYCISLSMEMCDWANWAEVASLVLERVEHGHLSTAPFLLQLLPSTPAQQRRNAADYFQYIAGNIRPAPIPATARTDKIRVGYFSADFCNHAVAYAIAEMFECHDTSRFEVAGFLLAPRAEDPMQLRIRGAFDHFIDVSSKSDRDVVALARNMKLDIAVDLMGYTAYSRPAIFAGRAAPIQISYLGYPGPLGASCIDYIFADKIVVPPDHRGDYSENICYLPDTYQANDSKRAISETEFKRSDFGLPESGTIFCCFNVNRKITPDVFDSWMRILSQVEGSSLWLHVTTAVAIDNLRKEAAHRGVSPHRLVFTPSIPLADHLARHRLADLFLDTFHYNGHGTTSHALWAGLPVLTKLGLAFAGRVSASLLYAAGLPELVANSVQQYEEMAIALGNRPDKIAALKQKLARNRISCPLFDTPRFTKNVEAAYQKMTELYRAGKPFEDIAPTVG